MIRLDYAQEMVYRIKFLNNELFDNSYDETHEFVLESVIECIESLQTTINELKVELWDTQAELTKYQVILEKSDVLLASLLIQDEKQNNSFQQVS